MSGSIRLDGEDLVMACSERLRRLPAAVAMIFQDPLSSLHPSSPRRAAPEAYRAHHDAGRRQAWARVSRCWTASASRIRGTASAATRTSCRAGCGSAS